MSDHSPRLDLPYILPSQAQKHVTHNEALQRLDALVHLTLQATEAETPPSDPGAGEIHALGAAPSGAWDGQAGQLALWDGSGWQFLSPQDGWHGFVRPTGQMVVFDAGIWRDARGDLDNLAGVGINTAYDPLNRLSLAAGASLFSHEGAGHQVKVNKAAAAETASLLFQSDWSGHAEMGLMGETAFGIKVSADGTVWNKVLRADPTVEAIELAPAGIPKATLSNDQLQLDTQLVVGDSVLNVETSTQRVGIGTSTPAGVLEILSDRQFDPATAPSSAHVIIKQSGGVPGLNAYGGGLVLSKIGSGRPGGAIAAVQTGVDVDEMGLALFTHSAAVSSNVLAEKFRIVHNGTVLADRWSGSCMAAGLGAAMEQGENANGQYWRFANGLQICGNGNAPISTAPAAFIGPITKLDGDKLWLGAWS